MISSRRFHVVLDVINCDDEHLSSQYFLEGIIKTIAEEIDMKIIAGPYVVEGIIDNPGLSAFAVIDYSHIAIHTFTKTGELCLDVFSCKQFDYKKLYEFVREILGVEDKDIRRAVVTYNGRPRLEKK